MTTSAPKTHRGRGRPRGDSLERPIKDELIDATVRIVGENGTTDSSSVLVAREAGVQPSTINYNFTSWAHLIAHAGWAAYCDLIDSLWQRVLDAPATPEDRLRAFLLAHHQWAVEHPGWVAFFSFPRSAQRASSYMFELFGDELRERIALSNTRLYRLAADVRDGRVTADNSWAETADPEQIIADTEVIAHTTVLTWTSIGITVSSGLEQLEQMGGDAARITRQTVERALDDMIHRLRSAGGPHLQAS
ncbi:TetR-like transcription factor [Pontimonas salivibrio]|uniref:TetR-like transcription factor n=1 Tax=Pontimonas salivibrio TaxID=1159327 RepID=A0A2L2BQA4_9MICO|nr:hypothetical protein [Pontimonas salivibrio]AVG23846.1 TetR-like transcription factor [Pontimonas salivibrio]